MNKKIIVLTLILCLCSLVYGSARVQDYLQVTSNLTISNSGVSLLPDPSGNGLVLRNVENTSYENLTVSAIIGDISCTNITDASSNLCTIQNTWTANQSLYRVSSETDSLILGNISSGGDQPVNTTSNVTFNELVVSKNTTFIGNVSFESGKLYIAGNTDFGGVIYFDSSETTKYLPSFGYSKFTNAFTVNQNFTTTQYLYSAKRLKTGGDIVTTGEGDDLWLGDDNQSLASFRAYANGSMYLHGAEVVDDVCITGGNCLSTVSGSSDGYPKDQSVNTTNYVNYAGVNITEGLGFPSLKIDANGATSTSTSTGGAFLLENTGNTGAGFIAYTNMGASASGRLANFRVNNPDFDQAAVHIDYAGNANAFEVVCTGGDSTSQCFNIQSSNTQDSTFTLTGVESARGTAKIVHDGNGSDSSASAISIDLQGTDTAAQGIFMDATEGGTSGDLILLKNNGVEVFAVNNTGKLEVHDNIEMEVNNKVILSIANNSCIFHNGSHLIMANNLDGVTC